MNDKTSKHFSFIINAAYVAIIGAICYVILKYAIIWVLPFLLAFAIVSLFNPMIRVIKKNLRIRQETVSIIVMLLVYLLLAMIIFLVIMQIAVLIRDGITMLPTYFDEVLKPSLVRANTGLIDYIDSLPPEWQRQILDIQSSLMANLGTMIANFTQAGMSVLSGITASLPSFFLGFVFTIMLSFFISTQYLTVVKFVRAQFPESVRGLIADLQIIIKDTVLKYLRAALTLMIITFIELSVGLSLIRTKNAIIIAFGIAIFDALPFFGTGAVLLPWAAIEALQANFQFAFGLVVLYVFVLFVRNVIEPKIVGDKLGLNPIVSLTAIYLGFKIFGVLGMIVMPITLQIFLQLHARGRIKIFKPVS